MKIKVNAADRAFSKALRAKYPVCQICGVRPATQLCHIIGRRNNAVRYCLDNVYAGCLQCHLWEGENPLQFNDWLEANHPGRKDRIYLKARGILKNTATNRALIAKHYKEQLKLIQENPDHKLESWN